MDVSSRMPFVSNTSSKDEWKAMMEMGSKWAKILVFICVWRIWPTLQRYELLCRRTDSKCSSDDMWKSTKHVCSNRSRNFRPLVLGLSYRSCIETSHLSDRTGIGKYLGAPRNVCIGPSPQSQCFSLTLLSPTCANCCLRFGWCNCECGEDLSVTDDIHGSPH